MIRDIIRMGDKRLLRVAPPVTNLGSAELARAGGRHVRNHGRCAWRRFGSAADRGGSAIDGVRLRRQRALSRSACGTAYGPGQRTDRTTLRRDGKRLGGLFVDPRPARSDSTLSLHSVPRALHPMTARSRAKPKVSTHVWCNTNTTTWSAVCIPRASKTSTPSVSKTCCLTTCNTFLWSVVDGPRHVQGASR